MSKGGDSYLSDTERRKTGKLHSCWCSESRLEIKHNDTHTNSQKYQVKMNIQDEMNGNGLLGDNFCNNRAKESMIIDITTK